MKKRILAQKPLALVIATCGLPGVVNAAGTDDGLVLEEIVVHAQKREERMVDVPISVTALSRADLEGASIVSLADISDMVPNLVFTNLGSNSASIFSIRGFGSDTTNPGLESGVAVYQDGVFLGRSAAFNSAMVDLETVEVLRGPQGTLYGRNSILGAFNVISRKPIHELEGYIDLGIGNYGLRQTKGMLNLPVNDTLALRFSGISVERDGFLHNTATDDDVNDKNTHGGRMMALYEPSDDLSIVFSIDGQQDRSNGVAKESTTSRFDRASLSDRKIAINDVEFDNRNIWGTSLTVNYSLGDLELTSITAYRETDYELIQDVDYSTADLVVGQGEQDQNQFSQEFRIDSPASDRLTWTLGLYYFTQTFDTINTFSFDDAAIGGPGGTRFDLNSSSGETTDAYAVFGNTSYDLTDKLAVTLGLRYTSETKSMHYMQTLTPGDLGGPFVNIAPFEDKATSSALSPSVVFNYAWDENLNTYAKVVRGFKSGGFNASIGASPTGTAFDPEYITSYEIGLKTSALDHKLAFNAAVFYLDYTDIQVNNSTPFGQSIVTNDAESASSGFEMDITARPIENLKITASAGYTKMKKLHGRPMEAYHPKWTGSLATDYNFTLNDTMEMFMRGDLNYRSAFHSTRQHIFSNSDTLTANARVGIDVNQGEWQVYLWGRNLTDEIVFSNMVPDVLSANLEAPRTFGIGANLTF